MDRNLIDTRPNDRSNLNTIAFIGTEIDDLRNKVLSAWLGAFETSRYSISYSKTANANHDAKVRQRWRETSTRRRFAR